MRTVTRSRSRSFRPITAIRPPWGHRRRPRISHAAAFVRTILDRYRRRGSWNRLAEILLRSPDLQAPAPDRPSSRLHFHSWRLLLSILSNPSPPAASSGVARSIHSNRSPPPASLDVIRRPAAGLLHAPRHIPPGPAATRPPASRVSARSAVVGARAKMPPERSGGGPTITMPLRGRALPIRLRALSTIPQVVRRLAHRHGDGDAGSPGDLADVPHAAPLDHIPPADPLEHRPVPTIAAPTGTPPSIETSGWRIAPGSAGMTVLRRAVLPRASRPLLPSRAPRPLRPPNGAMGAALRRPLLLDAGAPLTERPGPTAIGSGPTSAPPHVVPGFPQPPLHHPIGSPLTPAGRTSPAESSLPTAVAFADRRAGAPAPAIDIGAAAKPQPLKEFDPAALRHALNRIPASDIAPLADKLFEHFQRHVRRLQERRGLR